MAGEVLENLPNVDLVIDTKVYNASGSNPTSSYAIKNPRRTDAVVRIFQHIRPPHQRTIPVRGRPITMADPHGAQRQLRLFRSVLGVPQFDASASDSTKTVAVTYGKNGKTYFAVPSLWSLNWAKKRKRFARKYGITNAKARKSLKHAEATGLILYYEDMGTLIGEELVLFVDRTPCKEYCHNPELEKKGGLELIQQQTELDVMVVSDLEGSRIVLKNSNLGHEQ